MHSAMNTTGTALISTESPHIARGQLVAAADGCCNSSGSLSQACRCHLLTPPVSAKVFFRACVRHDQLSNSRRCLHNHHHAFIQTQPCGRRLHNRVSWGFSFLFRSSKGVLRVEGEFQHGSMFNNPFLRAHTMQSLCIPHTVPHLREWRTINYQRHRHLCLRRLMTRSTSLVRAQKVLGLMI